MAFHNSFQNEKKLKIDGVIKNIRGADLKKTPCITYWDERYGSQNTNRLNGGRSTRTASIRAVAPISLFPVWVGVYVRWGGEGAGGYAETWLRREANLPN